MQGGERGEVLLDRGGAAEQIPAGVVVLDLAQHRVRQATARSQLHAVDGQVEQEADRGRHRTGGPLDEQIGAGQVEAVAPGTRPTPQVVVMGVPGVGHTAAGRTPGAWYYRVTPRPTSS